MSGPAPKPAALKLLTGRGNGRDAGGRVVKTPPAFKRTAPRRPPWLSPEGRRVWDETLPELVRLDLVKSIDAPGLAAYCEAAATFERATRDITKRGLVIVNKGKGGTEWEVPNPTVGIQMKAGQLLRAWAGEFGLTPSAEQKVGKAAADGDDESPFGG